MKHENRFIVSELPVCNIFQIPEGTNHGIVPSRFTYGNAAKTVPLGGKETNNRELTTYRM
jgi:hypothetical protein